MDVEDAGVVQKLREGVTTQMPSSSSDRGSKLLGPSQNSPRVASIRDVNLTKLTILTHRRGHTSNLRGVGLRVERRHHLQSVCPQDVVLVD
ncbi:hypothetical protein AVEN_261190-1 [Araneus ventricosus]|uniref:Uncharacterized protein n=1 Tax=Araneus ventricosus TaxID=182803 RepID=A0A4Y1ZRH3_ARAVE|nr:hypothetical protein AVEN_258273-1 [Araneus ventricosus]GBL64206.1 hypothetical protein AVEN_261190-1 [Araneus ventricosus]